jgi:hypothetical protein
MKTEYARFGGSVLIAALLATGLVAVTGATPRAQGASTPLDTLPPSWFGVWSNSGPPPGAPPVENSKAVQESGYFLEHLQPWAKLRYETTEWEYDDTGARCQLVGLFRQGTGNNSTFRWMESAPGRIYKMSGTYEQTGIHPIYFNSDHPQNLRPTWNGDARAHWDGDTLVVDIIGFNDQSWLNTDRWPHTEALHVVERYRLIGDGSYMELRVFLDDRRAFTSPMTYTRYYRKSPEPTQSTERVCNPQEEGANLWWDRYKMAMDDYNADFDAYMKKTVAESPAAPGFSGPASIGRGGGGRGGRGAAPQPPPEEEYPDAAPAGGRGAGRGGAAAAAPVAPTVAPMTAADRATLRTFRGAYRLTAFDATLPGGLKNAGTLDDLPLTPAAVAAAKTHDVANDPAKYCQAIGPFRLLAHSGNAFEILPTGQGAVMAFESVALGDKRDIIFGRDHLQDLEPNWNGDSIGRIEGDTFVVDTTSFNDRTWLNDAAAQHGPKLHMVERYRLVPNSDLMEVKVTIDDADMLSRPYSYTRYYQRSNTGFSEDFCVADEIL